MMRTLLFLTLDCIFYMCSEQAQTCSKGPHNLARFGPSCEYLCHCSGKQCDLNTGECPYNMECDAGWMGSGCQYANIAYNASVQSNHWGDGHDIVDGRNSTCANSTSMNIDVTYFVLDLGREMKITEVHLVFLKTVPSFIVSVIGPNNTNPCNSALDALVKDEYIVVCGSQLYGQKINITFQGPNTESALCEVQVAAGRNLAYGKPTNQSTTFETYYASQAVDGDWKSGSFQLAIGTCTHTNMSIDLWWVLDLETSVMIEWFRIYDRDDEGKPDLTHRLQNFRIFLGDESTNLKLVYQDQNIKPLLVTEPSLDQDVLARFVKIDLNGTYRILTLCEVEVFGECKTPFYGNCFKPCGHCANGRQCNKVSGYCDIGGCADGWQTIKCDTPCNDTYYGNCMTKCGSCRFNAICDKTNGSCPSGLCAEGWHGENCDKVCNETYYGQNCASKCGYCRNGTCDRFTGNCSKDDGCDPGWQGSRCDTPCSDNYYGNCTTRCGNCRPSTICNQTDGYCQPSLCSEGWNGEKCDIMCDSKHYGQNCAHECGRCLNGTCDPITGNCSEALGCQPGWHGPRCDLGSAENQIANNPIEPSILGGSIGGAVGIIIVIVIIIIVKRRRGERSSSTTAKTRYLSREKNDGRVYENSAFSSTSDDIHPNQGMRKESNESIRSKMLKQEQTATKLKTDDSETYYNVGRALPAGAVLLSMFWDYVQEKFLDEKFLPKEFEKLPSGPQFPTTIALRLENKNKNRYKQLYAYDVNRVILKPMGDDANDYINASFIDGYSHQKMYIASQGTTKDNLNDFWRMLWQYHVEKIVMLTELFEGGRHKCELYWPEEGQTRTFGSVVVRLLVTDAYADYNIRTLEMSVAKKSKQLIQFHFTAWPDKGVPKAASSIVQFWNTVNKVPTKEPIVVHCSAGIGRTGTYIALDYLVSQGKAEGYVNVSACVSNLRRQRVNLVQTQEQYLFLHETLMEALMLSGTATTSDNFPKVYSELLEFDSEIGKLKLQLEYERLQNEIVNHEAVYATIKMNDEEGGEGNSNQDEFSAAKHIENRTKNRHDNILPADRHRVFLNTTVSGRNDYINAVVLPSHKQRKAFILTQMPLTDTVIDFWRMINDFETKTIIMFNSESSKTDNIGIYWPREGEAKYGPFSVRLTHQENCKNYVERTMSFSLTGEVHDRSVKQFQFTNWAENSNVPGSTESILQLLCDVESWQKETEAKPVVVHCLNGAQRSGLYCVISTVIERLKVERDVAISQTIKRSRAIRQQIIPNFEQFQFCYECILQYMKTLETYSNFSTI